MYQTEEEAREKWCPEYRCVAGVDEGGGDNRPFEYEKVEATGTKGEHWKSTGRLHPDCRCIASQCLAWRWGDPETGKSELPSGKIIDVTLNERGYCGLAGKPG